MVRRTLAATLALPLLALALAIGCNGDDNGNGEPTPPPETPPAASPTPENGDGTPTSGIRSIMLIDDPAVQELVDDTGGEFVQADVLYVDLTDDGAEDAVVPVSSGGTLGMIAYVVLALDGDGTRVLLREVPDAPAGFTLDIEDGRLVEIAAVPGPDDPFCCPSMLRRTTWAWDGDEFVVDGVETVDNPDAIKPDAANPGDLRY
jgi:hypothetical protein